MDIVKSGGGRLCKMLNGLQKYVNYGQIWDWAVIQQWAILRQNTVLIICLILCRTWAQSLHELVGDTTRLPYPDRLSGTEIPHDVYTRPHAKKAKKLASKIVARARCFIEEKWLVFFLHNMSWSVCLFRLPSTSWTFERGFY